MADPFTSRWRLAAALMLALMLADPTGAPGEQRRHQPAGSVFRAKPGRGGPFSGRLERAAGQVLFLHGRLQGALRRLLDPGSRAVLARSRRPALLAARADGMASGAALPQRGVGLAFRAGGRGRPAHSGGVLSGALIPRLFGGQHRPPPSAALLPDGGREVPDRMALCGGMPPVLRAVLARELSRLHRPVPRPRVGRGSRSVGGRRASGEPAGRRRVGRLSHGLCRLRADLLHRLRWHHAVV